MGAPDEDPDGDATPFTLNLRFPGQYFDQETNSHYNFYRDHYFPSLGRYGQSDPIGLLGGINTYGYVNGNPLLWGDPEGLQATVALGGFGSGSLAAGAGTTTGLGVGALWPGVAVGAAAFGGYGLGTWLYPHIEPGLSRAVDWCIGKIEDKDKCIEQCWPILERPKKFPGDDSATWDFHRCVNKCMGLK
jgi:RHS repeat-associated protein